MTSINVEELVPHPTTMKLMHPVTGETTFKNDKDEDVEGVLTVVGHFSQEFYDAIFTYMDNDQPKGSVVDHLDEQTVKMTAACVIGWEDNGFFDEPYSKEGIEGIMLDPRFRWVTNQVREFVADKAHFFSKPLTS